MKKLLTAVAIAASFPVVVFAEDASQIKGVIYGTYMTGDADIKLAGTTYDADLSGTGLSGHFYPAEMVYLSASITSQEMDVLGVTIDGDTKSFGGGLVFGDRIDYRTGEGSEQRLGFDWTDVEVSLGNVKSSEDYVDIEYAVEAGLGDGVTGGFYFSTDTDDIFSDNSYSFALYKSLGGGLLIGGEYGFSKSVTDSNNSTETSGILIGVGYAF
jgi:hypothetical protein